MDTFIWALQGVLALAFLAAGAFKLSTPKAQLAEKGLTWVEDFSEQQVKAIGAVEVLGAVGLILPAAIDVLPWLTPVAAAGLALTMAGAAATHARRGELPNIGVNVALGAIALAIAILRFGPYSF